MKKIRTIYTIILFCFWTSVSGQNPIVPAGMYIADPSAHQWNDGKMYVYGSRDESPEYYCSWSHHVLSTSDLKTWSFTEKSFASKGPNDQVPYSDDFLYAPDCQYYKGTYYLYYCLANNTFSEGVATSKSPTGPDVYKRQAWRLGWRTKSPGRQRRVSQAVPRKNQQHCI